MNVYVFTVYLHQSNFHVDNTCFTMTQIPTYVLTLQHFFLQSQTERLISRSFENFFTINVRMIFFKVYVLLLFFFFSSFYLRGIKLWFSELTRINDSSNHQPLRCVQLIDHLPTIWQLLNNLGNRNY